MAAASPHHSDLQPANSAGGSNISALSLEQFQAMEEQDEAPGDEVGNEPMVDATNGAVGTLGALNSQQTAGNSVFTRAPGRAPGVTGSTSTVHEVPRQAFSIGDSCAMEGRDTGNRREDPEAHGEVVGPARRSCPREDEDSADARLQHRGTRHREDGDSANARFLDIDEGEELDSGRAERSTGGRPPAINSRGEPVSRGKRPRLSSPPCRDKLPSVGGLTDDEVSIGNAFPPGDNQASPARESPVAGTPADRELGHEAAGPSKLGDYEWFDKEPWQLQLRDCLRAAEKHKVDGNAHFTSGNTKNALEKYTCALKYVEFETVFDDEDAPVAHSVKLQLLLNAAACNLHLAQFKEAVELCNHACELDDTSTKALYSRAHAHIGCANYNLADGDLVRALELEPANEQLNNAQRQLRQRMDQTKKEQQQMCARLFEAGLFDDIQMPPPRSVPAALPKTPVSEEKEPATDPASEITYHNRQDTPAQEKSLDTRGGSLLKSTALESQGANGGAVSVSEYSEEDGDEFVSPAIAPDNK
ncbi:hypothetical protein CYMTET_45313 [Cymbomonas tetramitiformis]|uniref:peptidylprolyl isomerase n=1 Tax=Cymbomonas tetramitiformis TaxID=36881 RepID=A0AAE0BZR0_9CHLO|nr:hypothetical protein CYMTET_45314 [Cymbomonas tetramitiformis]KAK3245100.1 hypothetical protein CYMTET_45313 [Cymbomonas tetramitiformis]